MLKRLLKIDLPARQSAFLWGPRKTGKSTFLKDAFPDSLCFNFLDTDLRIEVGKRPAVLRERILTGENKSRLRLPIILDEVQKVPEVLDEVHRLIEEKGLRFIMCGSSARKLKRGHANLLGGRAWRFELFPLTVAEIPDFRLLTALSAGLIPSHYLGSHPDRSLKSYVNDYLNEEIRAEGLTRNMPAFSRFLDAAAFSNGQMVNFNNIARDCGVDAKTVREYFHILEDPLLGRFVEPFSRVRNRQIITRASKFYFFDTGLAAALAHRTVTLEKGEEFGVALEHLVAMELFAYRGYSEKDFDIRFWRTSTGLEVDFVLANGSVAVEVKGSQRVDNTTLRGLKAFADDYRPKRCIVVCNEKARRNSGGIELMPWRNFFEALHEGMVV